MLKQMPKLVLLVALVATFLVSSAPAFAHSCGCLVGNKIKMGGCKFVTKGFVGCFNMGCPGICQ